MRPGRVKHILALALIAGVLSACAPAVTGTAPARSRSHGDPLEAGISYGDVLRSFSSARLAAALNDAVYTGATWVRVDLAWDDVEQTQGQYSWAGFDRIAEAARARHLSVLALLSYTPSFARPGGCDSDKCGPADPAAFASFAAAAARRYAPMGVHTWEIWNEPNSDRFWQPAPDPGRYAELVRLTVAAIRSVQPRATVVLGSLAAGKLTGVGIPALEFLQRLCAAGVNRLVNAIGWHPYSYPELPSSADPHNPWNFISTDSPSFESILAQAGTPHLPVWITEYGAPTSGPGRPADGPKHPPGIFPAYVTQAFQARLTRVAVATAEADPSIAAFFWFTDEDSLGPADIRGDYFGLRRVDGTPKPALAALRQAVRELPRQSGSG
jgi:hypothetical protein